MSSTNPEHDLTPAEVEDLNRLEAVAQLGLGIYVEVGSALAEIRDRHLYRNSPLRSSRMSESDGASAVPTPARCRNPPSMPTLTRGARQSERRVPRSVTNHVRPSRKPASRPSPLSLATIRGASRFDSPFASKGIRTRWQTD